MQSYLKITGIFFTGLVTGAVLYAYAPTWFRTADSALPVNHVEVTERIHTSGQPSQHQLGALASAGYDAVINLAQPDVFGSIAHEGGLVGSEGMSYVNIPVDWDHPEYEDFELFSGVLQLAGPRRVLVHCQINKRASLFTFLYRVVHEGADPDSAYDKVTAVWVPEGHWRKFAQEVLARHNINFAL